MMQSLDTTPAGSIPDEVSKILAAARALMAGQADDERGVLWFETKQLTGFGNTTVSSDTEKWNDTQTL